MPGRFRTGLNKAGKVTGRCLQTAAGQTCRCIIWTACAPCICCAIFLLPNRRSPVPRPGMPLKPNLPMPRRRALSIPSPHFQDDQRVLDQPASQFMSKLPMEIRRIIYGYALGGRSIHMRMHDQQLYARHCDALRGCQCEIKKPQRKRRLNLALALLRTCRLIYSEAIEFLYTSNYFSLSTASGPIPTLDHLSYFILPQRLTQIRHLDVYWEIDNYHYDLFHTVVTDPQREPWTLSWISISRLTGLRYLHVRLAITSDLANFLDKDTLWERHGTQLLERIPKLAVKHFLLTLPSPWIPNHAQLQNPQCVLRLPSEEEIELQK